MYGDIPPYSTGEHPPIGYIAKPYSEPGYLVKVTEELLVNAYEDLYVTVWTQGLLHGWNSFDEDA